LLLIGHTQSGVPPLNHRDTQPQHNNWGYRPSPPLHFATVTCITYTTTSHYCWHLRHTGAAQPAHCLLCSVCFCLAHHRCYCCGQHGHAWPWWGLLSHNLAALLPITDTRGTSVRRRFPAAPCTPAGFAAHCSTWRRGTAADKPLLWCPALALLALALRSLFQFGHVARNPRCRSSAASMQAPCETAAAAPGPGLLAWVTAVALPRSAWSMKQSQQSRCSSAAETQLQGSTGLTR
jgi:hypothetical protein